MTRFIQATAIVFLATSLAACNRAPTANPNVELAKAWVTAASTSRISSTTTKAQMLEWMATLEDDDWGPDKWELHEAVGQGDVVYVWTQAWNTDEATGLPFEAHQVTRMMFNESGQVQAIASLSEDRFVLEQMGYTVSR